VDGTEWRWPVSGTEVRRNRGTTAVGAGCPPRIDLRSSAHSVAAVRCPVLTKDVDGRASAGGSSDSGSLSEMFVR